LRILLDESVARKIEDALFEDGHDIAAVRLLCPGAPDAEVMARAVRDQRILVTYDRDFGELIFRQAVRPAPTTLYIRSNGESVATLIARIRIRLPRLEAGFLHVINGSVMRRRRIDGSS